MSTDQTEQTTVQGSVRLGASIPLDLLGDPGTYVCDWSGHLLRVHERAFGPGRTTGLNIIGREPLSVTKLADDPDVPLREAQRVAKQLRVPVSF